MKWWVAVIVLGAACTGRPSAKHADESTTGDDGDDDEASEVTGGFPACGGAQSPAVKVDIWPGEDPDDAGTVVLDQECTIAGLERFPEGVRFSVECPTSPGEYVLPSVSLTAPGVVIPDELELSSDVHVRAFTYRDAQFVEEFPWRRANHFAIYRDDELVLAAGTGARWPSTADGRVDPDFWSPLRITTVETECSVEPRECHEAEETALRIAVGDETTVAAAYSVVSIGGYDVQVGEMVDVDVTACEEPSYAWMSFAIAKTP